MMIIKKVDVFPAVQSNTKVSYMYFIRATANHGNGSEQSQCLAISEDGINFEKYDGNPLLMHRKVFSRIHSRAIQRYGSMKINIIWL